MWFLGVGFGVDEEEIKGGRGSALEMAVVVVAGLALRRTGGEGGVLDALGGAEILMGAEEEEGVEEGLRLEGFFGGVDEEGLEDFLGVDEEGIICDFRIGFLTGGIEGRGGRGAEGGGEGSWRTRARKVLLMTLMGFLMSDCLFSAPLSSSSLGGVLTDKFSAVSRFPDFRVLGPLLEIVPALFLGGSTPAEELGAAAAVEGGGAVPPAS